MSTEAEFDFTSDGTVVTVVARGEIDMANGDELQQMLEQQITNQATQVIVDLDGVTYIDSIGMRLLFGLAGRLRTAQIDLLVRAPVSSPARRVIEVSGLAASVRLDPPG